MEKKHSLNIGLSSMACWLFLNGDMGKPIRAFADANCDVFTGEFRQMKDKDGNYTGGEEFLSRHGNYIEYSPEHIMKLRSGWDGYTDEKYYGKIMCREGNSPFLK